MSDLEQSTGPLEFSEALPTLAEGTSPALPAVRPQHLAATLPGQRRTKSAASVEALPALTLPEIAGHEACHLLVLPGGVSSDEVAILAMSRFSSARWAVVPGDLPATATGDGAASVHATVAATEALPRIAAIGSVGELRLTRNSRLLGPFGPPDALSLVADTATGWAPSFPEDARAVWVVLCPRERWDSPPHAPELVGLDRAFPAGLPNREEGRVVAWLVDAARRLGGHVIGDATNVTAPVLTPDPAQQVNLTLYSNVWLDPNACQRVARAVDPQAALATEGVDFAGPSPELTAPRVSSAAAAALGQQAQLTPVEAAKEALGQELLSALHTAADEVDREALALPHVLDGYGITVEIGGDGVVAVEVSGAEDLPPLLKTVEWASTGAICYRAWWAPDDESGLYEPRPTPEFRAARARAAEAVVALTAALWLTAGGEVVDQAEFLVDPEALGQQLGG